MVDFKEQKIRDGIMPWPVQPPVPTSVTNPPAFVPPKTEAYSRNELMPGAVAELVGDHSMRGYQYVSIRLNPVRYLGATKELYLVSEVLLELMYEPAIVRTTARPGKANSDSAEAVRRLVINPEEVVDIGE